ncbi:hypothetical protein T265_10914 [Opisthorchis viverrini]|uniref:Uncharacterized protein n=1 Tax=Opisthorchis viverrini TaxID=6198 RepID=A0A074Z0J8_OPIVI|nr:hypothetical protein T265_10914 [Opisthorchis viverrini]KER20566.1 hypothetical protein T265_10914 [Opisthorchis viverrini]
MGPTFRRVEDRGARHAMRVAVPNGSVGHRHSYADLHHPLETFSEKHIPQDVESMPTPTNLVTQLRSSVGNNVLRPCFNAFPDGSTTNREELIVHEDISHVVGSDAIPTGAERHNVHLPSTCTSEPVDSRVHSSGEADITSTNEVDQCCLCFCCQSCRPSKAGHVFCDSSNLSNCSGLRAILSSFSCSFLPVLFDCRLSRWYRRRIPNENLLVLSIIQVLCGFASIILSSVALTKAVFLYRMATGMWAGFLMLITGTQGLIASRRPITCTLVGLLVLCVITTLAACLLIGVSVAGTIEDGFLEQNSAKSRSVHQVVRLIFAYHDDGKPFKDLYSQPDHFISATPVNWTGAGLSHTKSINPGLRTHFSDSHLRTCQVILHVLLLLVGILNCSVSLSTSVLCGRYVCSRSRRFTTDQNHYTSRTNIVSFDNATASQAVSLLQSGDVRHFIGSGNILLAVAPDSLRRHELDLVRTNDNYTRLDPCLHHTVSPFLPESNRSALILTQAGTGAMAWTAARAAATLLSQQESPRSTTLPEDSQYRESTSSISRLVRANLRPRKNQRPRLLLTSLNSETAHPSHLSAPPYPSISTMLYVMPSPTSDEPPMIFPPFPPTYSSLQKRPSTSIFSRIPEPRNTRPHDRTAEQTSPDVLPARAPVACVLSRIFRRRISRRQRSSHSRRRNTERRTSQPRRAASSLMCAVDRLLQPVLIVEDPGACTSHQPGRPSNPPAYSTLYPDCTHQSDPSA